MAKLLDSPSHFSKFDIFREPKLNTYLKGRPKKILKNTDIIFIENINKSTKYVYWIYILKIKYIDFTYLDNSSKFGE